MVVSLSSWPPDGREHIVYSYQCWMAFVLSWRTLEDIGSVKAIRSTLMTKCLLCLFDFRSLPGLQNSIFWHC